jgi:multicomponent Na+:H+ antiporter subunit C
MLPYAVVLWLFAVGVVGIATSRNLIHLILCVNVMQSSTYVLLLSIGFRAHATAPVFGDVAREARTVDPIVQALTLTDVVVGVAVTALLLALAVQVHKRSGTLDPDELRALRG